LINELPVSKSSLHLNWAPETYLKVGLGCSIFPGLGVRENVSMVKNGYCDALLIPE